MIFVAENEECYNICNSIYNVIFNELNQARALNFINEVKIEQYNEQNEYSHDSIMINIQNLQSEMKELINKYIDSVPSILFDKKTIQNRFEYCIDEDLDEDQTFDFSFEISDDLDVLLCIYYADLEHFYNIIEIEQRSDLIIIYRNFTNEYIVECLDDLLAEIVGDKYSFEFDHQGSDSSNYLDLYYTFSKN